MFSSKKKENGKEGEGVQIVLVIIKNSETIYTKFNSFRKPLYSCLIPTPD